MSTWCGEYYKVQLESFLMKYFVTLLSYADDAMLQLPLENCQRLPEWGCGRTWSGTKGRLSAKKTYTDIMAN